MPASCLSNIYAHSNGGIATMLIPNIETPASSVGRLHTLYHHWLLHCGGEGDAKAELQVIQMILGSP